MAEKINQRVAVTKRLLKESLIEILSKKTIRKVTVTELCLRAGINRSTFYAHYRIPSDILTEIKKDFSAALAESSRSKNQKGFSYEKLKDICRFIYDNRSLQKIILLNSSDDEVLEAALESSIEIWGPEKDIDYLRRTDRDSAVLIRSFYYYGIYHLLREWTIHEFDKTPEEVARIIYKILTDSAERDAF
ncbi:MAG: TetR/AcrR family transcriptional regulator [bacterium]